MLPEQFTWTARSVAQPEAVVRVGSARFTLLTERLIRLEYDPAGTFEDRASQTVWYRQQPVPAFTVDRADSRLTIETAAFTLCYEEDGAFTPANLSIRIKGVEALWHPGDVDAGNLKGTTRTLDFTNGHVPLNDGLISRSGWALLDDSTAFVFNADSWLEPRAGQGVDWYFFAYGHDYKAGLRDYCAVSGPVPLIPRWILGNWWSRYWAYTQEELTTLLTDARTHGIPFSVCIVDMDWHITQTGNASTGWTGYTWNRDLFPDPQGMLDFMHAQDLRTALNLHPAEGIHPHEAQYPDMARRMGIDPASKQPIPFDITDPAFVKAYFEVLHHPYEAMGVDFWWIDWQQGLSCKIPGLDPLWLINHLHFLDAGRDLARRPFIFSRWGGDGHQRYPIGFSGDSYMTWETLRFEPYMTAAASNVAYGWWSHDIGGHVSGTGDSELFTRWVQFGVLSPIMRIHSTKGYFYDQRPWAFDDAEVRAVLRNTMQLRHALIPYLYTMAWRAHRESLPLLLPMYYEHPEADAAYHCPQQYYFGTELIAAPFVEPADPAIALARQVVWLPAGDWYHFFTGAHYEGDRWHAVYGALNEIPLFAKAGAIVPMGVLQGWGGIDNPDDLHLHVFAGADNTFTLYEDDGSSQNYLNGDFCQTKIVQRWADAQLDLTIHPAEGNTHLIPAERAISIHLHSVKASARISVQLDGSEIAPNITYDAATETLSIDGITLTPAALLTVRAQSDDGTLLARRERKRETLLKMLRAFRLHSGVRNRLAEIIDALIVNPDEIAPYIVTMQSAHVRALCEVLYEAGAHYIAEAHDPALIVVWNNRDDQAITYRYGEAFLEFGAVRFAKHHRGSAPRFAAIIPQIKLWTHGMLSDYVQRTQWEVQIDYHNLASVTEAYRENTP
jgi:alpha-glucosidase (family GH31 glycosyl hydrolase)